MKQKRTHNTRLVWILLFLFVLCSVGESQDPDGSSKSHRCAAEIRSLNATRLTAPEVLSRLIETNEITVADYAGSGTSVTLEVVVGAEGRVLCIDNVRGHPLLTGRAVDSASKWHFKPRSPAGASRPQPFYGDLVLAIKRNRE
jgi:hypothetical protein